MTDILNKIKVLYEDNHIIIINKDAGIGVQSDISGDKPLNELVKEYIKIKYNKPGNVFAGLVHRIDRPVSGIVVFAKTTKALTRLSLMFKSRDIEKYYLAIVKNRPPKTKDRLTDYLKKNSVQNKSYIVNETASGSVKAEMEYEVIDSIDRYFLLQIRLLTGKHHQIRSQLANIACPIKGDLKYGFDRPNKDASINLHAYKIEFIHPVTHEKVKVVAQPPQTNLWEKFNNLH